jgi:hypothetical protein
VPKETAVSDERPDQAHSPSKETIVGERRRLSVIAGMALSAVIIAAPAAHADDGLKARQDCSKTIVKAEENYSGLLGLDRILLAGAVLLNGNADLDDPTESEDSFNCSNFLHDSFNKFDDHGHHGRDDHWRG